MHTLQIIMKEVLCFNVKFQEHNRISINVISINRISINLISINKVFIDCLLPLEAPKGRVTPEAALSLLWRSAGQPSTTRRQKLTFLMSVNRREWAQLQTAQTTYLPWGQKGGLSQRPPCPSCNGERVYPQGYSKNLSRPPPRQSVGSTPA